MNEASPNVTIVGAGPGDPDLITVKGLRALESADAVLYDALVSPALLDHIGRDAVRIYVGKRPGAHSRTQEEINELLVESARRYGHVVRLKGGDPFVFGRGYEELEYLVAHGIEVEVIPGISSAIAAPELQGIPLTCRGIAESFWVVTATTAGGAISRDLYAAARSSATVVVLMGVAKIAEIARIFGRAGRGRLPVAIIQNGSLPEERAVVGRMNEIDRIAERAGISSPAVIVIGETVSLRTGKIASRIAHPLIEETA